MNKNSSTSIRFICGFIVVAAIVTIVIILIKQHVDKESFVPTAPSLIAKGAYGLSENTTENGIQIFTGDTYIIISKDAVHKKSGIELYLRNKINGETEYTEWNNQTDKIKSCETYSYSLGRSGEQCFRIEYSNENYNIDRQYEVKVKNNYGENSITIIQRHVKREDPKSESSNSPSNSNSSNSNSNSNSQNSSSNSNSTKNQATISGLTYKTALSACEAKVRTEYTGDLNSVDSAKISGDSWKFELEYLADSDHPGIYYLVVINCTVSGTNSNPKVTSYSSDIHSYVKENEDGYYEYDYYSK